MGNDYMLVVERFHEEFERLELTQQRLCGYLHMRQSNLSKSIAGYRRFSYSEMKGLCGSSADVFYIFTGIKATDDYGLPEPHSARPEELLCCLGTVYLHIRAAGLLNRDKASCGMVQKQLEYIQCAFGKLDGRDNIFYQVQHHYNYTQEKMAEILGTSTRSLQALENGRKLPDSEMIWKMYDRFLVSPAFILNDPRGMWNELNHVLSLLEKDSRDIILKLLDNSFCLMRRN